MAAKLIKARLVIENKYEVLNEVSEISLNKTTFRYKYGNNDKLPNDLIRAIADSGTATSCLGKLQAFIEAEGFINEATKLFKVNKTQTADDLLSDLAPMEVVFDGHALRVMVTTSGEVGNVKSLPIKALRRESNGHWAYNPLMGEKLYTQNEDEIIPEFDPNGTPQERAKILAGQLKKYGSQIGFILVSFQKTLQHYGDVLPIPVAWSGLEDIQTDAALQRLDRRNVKKGFKANVIISMPGVTDDQTRDEETGKTESDLLDETLMSFTGEEAASIMKLESNVPGEFPVITPFPFQEILNGTASTRDRIPKAVCRHMGVHPLLIGIELPSILGSDAAVSNSLKMFLFSIKNKQRRIQRSLRMLYPNMDWTISEINPYSTIMPEVFGKLTDDEIREIGGYAPLKSEIDTSVKTLAETLGVGGLQSLTATLSDLNLTAIQKQNMLEIIFGLSSDNALKLAPNGTA